METTTTAAEAVRLTHAAHAVKRIESDIAARRRAFIRRWNAEGVTTVRIARTLGISQPAVHQIIHSEDKK